MRKFFRLLKKICTFAYLRYFIKNYKEFCSDYQKYNITGYNRFLMFWDCFYCRHKFGCKFEEYFLLEYYKYRNSYRKDFLTKKYNHKELRRVNKRGSTTSKWENYVKLNKYYNREAIFCDGSKEKEKEFFAFLEKHKKVIIKPDHGSLGGGISVICDGNVEDAVNVLKGAKEKPIICEEYLVQHPVLNELSPSAVNTCRFLTFFDGNEVKILSAVIRCGKSGSVVDNICAGGICAEIDIDTGIISSYGRDYSNNYFMRHPDTNKIFMGVELPFWNEAVKLVKAIQLDFTECALTGIDIAFTVNGPCLIELNNAPGPLINQFISGKPCGREIHEFVKNNRLYDKNNNRIK